MRARPSPTACGRTCSSRVSPSSMKTNLTTYCDSDLTLEKVQETAHKYYIDDLRVRDKKNINCHGDAVWVGQDPKFMDSYNCGVIGLNEFDFEIRID